MANSVSINESLGLGPPPSSAVDFIASFQVSLPLLLACVQDIVVLYPIWESFEPALTKNGAPLATRPGMEQFKKDIEKFGPEEAEALVRKMIEDRMIDANHPDHAGNGEGHQVIGKKRKA